MSWKEFTDGLVATGKIDKAALYSRSDINLWAQSSGFILNNDEIINIAEGFDDSKKLESHGLHIQSQKYFLIFADQKSIYGKHEEEGIIAARTNKAILVAHYPRNVITVEATAVVQKLVDYLRSLDY